MHVLFFNDDVNDFVIDTWLLSLRNRKLVLHFARLHKR